MRIAIRGHKSRGNDVIKCLQKLGGINTKNLNGKCNMLYYYISNNIITTFSNPYIHPEYVLLALDDSKPLL